MPAETDLVLRPALAYESKTTWWALIVSFVLLSAVFVWFVSPVMRPLDYAQLLIPLALLPLTILVSLGKTITLSADGVRYHPGSIGWLARFDPPWFISWRDLEDVRWARNGLVPFQLQLIERNGKRRDLFATQWYPSYESAKAGQRAAMSALSGRQREAVAQNLPIVQSLRDLGYFQSPSAASADTLGFDLAKSRAAMIGLCIALGLFVLWFCDVMVSDQMYVGNEPWLLLAVAGIVLSGLTFNHLFKNQVPRPHAAFVSFLLGVTVALSVHAGVLRANQWLDRDGPKLVSFTLEPDGSLRSDVSEVQNLPPDFFGNQVYWRNQKPGSTHRFKYFRGLGMTTLDIEEYRNRLSSHYGFDPGRTNFKTNR